MEYLFRQKDSYEDTTVFVRFNEDCILDITQKFREFLLGCGYHADLVNEYIPNPHDQFAGEFCGDDEVDLGTLTGDEE
jgi:hypothetical protein